MLQLTLDFVPAEDRMLLRIGMGEEEGQLWLTRAILKQFWPMLGQASLNLVSNPTLPSALRHEVAEMQRQSLAKALDYSTPYQVKPRTVLGGGPQLVTQVDVRCQEDNSLQLWLMTASGGRMTLGLDARIHAGLVDLLQKAISRTDWDIKLDVKPTLSPNATEPSVIH